MSEYSVALEKQTQFKRFIGEHGERLFALAENSDITLKTLRCVFSLSGEAFYWDQRVIPLIERAAELIPDWTLGEHMLEGDAAFYWFPSPLSMPFWSGEPAPLCAISWQRKVIDVTRAEPKPVDFYGWARVADNYVPVMAITWIPGESWRAVVESRRERLFPDLSDTPPESAYAESDARDERFLRLLSAAIAFLDQRILAPRAAHLSRADRRRVESLGIEPTVRVIELRKRERQHALDGDAHRDWACQWMVRGHWRNQWYRKLNRHQPKWISSYVKGPDDKPLKQPRATVFAVVR